MEERTSYHDTHNRLVTISLRKLEYYQGILFLTSNRGIQFDDAILSRIHLIIEYENLTREFRRDLWSTFLSKTCTMQGPAVVDEQGTPTIGVFSSEWTRGGCPSRCTAYHMLTNREQDQKHRSNCTRSG